MNVNGFLSRKEKQEICKKISAVNLNINIIKLSDRKDLHFNHSLVDKHKKFFHKKYLILRLLHFFLATKIVFVI